MKLENQVCTLTQGQTLKKLGIAMDSAFYRHPSTSELLRPGNVVTKSGTQYKKISVKQDKYTTCAFTDAELGAMLPNGYDTMYCSGEGWRGYDHDGNDFLDTPFAYEAELRADMLIYLLDNKVITPEECNKRLQES